MFTPIGDKAAGYVATTITKSGKQTEINTDIRTYIPEVMEITVKAPAGSKINVGKFSSYWVYDLSAASFVVAFLLSPPLQYFLLPP